MTMKDPKKFTKTFLRHQIRRFKHILKHGDDLRCPDCLFCEEANIASRGYYPSCPKCRFPGLKGRKDGCMDAIFAGVTGDDVGWLNKDAMAFSDTDKWYEDGLKNDGEERWGARRPPIPSNAEVVT
jgi:hypothetical protein